MKHNKTMVILLTIGLLYSSSATSLRGTEDKNLKVKGNNSARRLHSSTKTSKKSKHKYYVDTLEAKMKPYPDYAGPLEVSGEVNVKFSDAGDYFRFSLHADGLNDTCTECGVHIHTGTSCSDASLVGGHYWNPDLLEEDVWKPSFGAFYNSIESKVSTEFVLGSGFDLEENINHAVVIHDQNGARISCGILEVVDKKNKDKDTLFAMVGKYPGYDGPLSPMGNVEVNFDENNKFEFSLNVKGLSEMCSTCGVHIHEGTSCDDGPLVGGHYWNKDIFSIDPWNIENGSFYDSSECGKSDTEFDFDSGLNYFENIGHVIVLHDQYGTRIACGKLRSDFYTMNNIP